MPQCILRYDVLYALVRLLVENKAIVPVSSEAAIPAGRSSSQSGEGKTRPKVPLDLPDLPLKELGPQN